MSCSVQRHSCEFKFVEINICVFVFSYKATIVDYFNCTRTHVQLHYQLVISTVTEHFYSISSKILTVWTKQKYTSLFNQFNFPFNAFKILTCNYWTHKQAGNQAAGFNRCFVLSLNKKVPGITFHSSNPPASLILFMIWNVVSLTYSPQTLSCCVLVC